MSGEELQQLKEQLKAEIRAEMAPDAKQPSPHTGVVTNGPGVAVSSTHHLSQQGPDAQAYHFEYDNRWWHMLPVTTKGVAAELERWVVQQVARNSELRRPTNDCTDPLSWRIYNEWSERTRRDIDRGIYGAMTNGWWSVIEGSDDAFAEVLFICIRFRDPNWTRDHVKRIMANPEDHEVLWQAYLDLNHPKTPSPPSTGQPPDQSDPKSPSDGTRSSAI